MIRRIVDHAAARRAALVAAIWAPAALVVASEAVIIAVGATGPARLIVHWGGTERTGPWWTYAVLVAAIGFPVIALIGFFIVRATRMAGMNTWMPAIAIGITVFHTVGMGVGSVVLNASPLAPALPLGGGAVLAVLAAVATWRLLPQEAGEGERVTPAAALPVRAGEVAAWTGRAELPAWFIALIAAIASVLVAVGLTVLLTVGPRLWFVFVAPTLLFAALVTTAHFVVTAGPGGFVVRSVVGWPRLGIPAADIAKAGTASIDPLADFGGWGIRWVVGPNGKGRWGVITHGGPGLEVVRRDGRSIVVTLDDAGTAAAVLETYATNHASAT